MESNRMEWNRKIFSENRIIVTSVDGVKNAAVAPDKNLVFNDHQITHTGTNTIFYTCREKARDDKLCYQ